MKRPSAPAPGQCGRLVRAHRARGRLWCAAARAAGVKAPPFVLLAAGLLTGCPMSSLQSPCGTDFSSEECAPSACVDDADCRDGFECRAGRCEAECGPDAAGCAADAVCGPDGDCRPGTDVDPGSSPDGRDRDAATENPGNPWGPTWGPAGEICAEVPLTAQRRMPNVVLLIDQSASMTYPFGSEGSRWDVLKEALLGDGGLIPKFQHMVRFGVTLYSATNGTDEPPPPPPIGACPLLTSVDVAEGNLDAIRAAYEPAGPIEDTPTGDAIHAVLDRLITSGTLLQDADAAASAPTILILATDGEPDTCQALDPQTGQAEAVAAVESAYSLGVRTFVIAVAEEDELSREHVREMANAGAGVTAGQPDAPSFRVHDQGGLRAALLELVSGELSCEIQIGTHYPVAAGLCPVVVELDDRRLECRHRHGWRRVDDERLELLGAACERFKTGGDLRIGIPCQTDSFR